MQKIYLSNTLTKQKEEFIPLKSGEVKIYGCGVTVYDECHIGHFRSLYTLESFRRYLQSLAYSVTFVRNITDIDDKIIKRAQELGKPFTEVTKEFIALYYRDLASFGIEKADIEPRATEHIPQMIAMIETLIKKGFAYAADGDVYFRVRSYKKYGALSGQGIESMLEGVRIETDEKKEDPLDFALWKKSKPGEPTFPSPWSEGRPGWHIECSVMSTQYLGETFDIHAGGRDLVFPHHENEIAQAEAATGKQFARYWMHIGLLTIDGQKMSKSLHNFISLSTLLEQYHPDVIKLFFLSTHYSSPIDFNRAKIDEIKKAREKIIILLDRIERLIQKGGRSTANIDLDIIALEDRYHNALSQDFNTAEAQGFIFELVSTANKMIDAPDLSLDVKITNLLHIKEFIAQYQRLFGLTLEKAAIEIDEGYINEQIQRRNEARKAKNFKLSDEIRDELKKKGIILEDAQGETTWRRA